MSLRIPLYLALLVTGGLPSGVSAEDPNAAAAKTPTVAAPSHELGQSYAFLRIYDDSLIVRLEITTEDLGDALGFGWDPTEVSVLDVEARLDSIRAYMESHFSLSNTTGRLALDLQDVDVRFLELAEFVMLTYRVEGVEGVPDLLDVEYSVMFEVDDDHRNLIVMEHNWRTATFQGEVIALILSPRSPRQTLDLTSSTLWSGFLAFVWLGVWHIWIGIDHILFLLALTLPAVMTRREGQWQPVESFREALFNIVAIVTFFTLAHTVTLSLAALDIVRLPSRLVESIIAGSIAVAALANLRPQWTVKEWSIAFVFGLFHGFGFASVLGDIGMGQEFLTLSLLGFNVGVELGQIAIIGVAFPLLFLIRRKPIYRWVLRGGSIFLIAVATLWMFERVFDFNVPLVPIALAPFRWLMGGS